MPNITENDVLKFLSYSRAFPYLPFAKHIPNAGCTTAHTQHSPKGVGITSAPFLSSTVKVLAVLCSTDKLPIHQPSDRTSAVSSGRDSLDPTNATTANTCQREDEENSRSYKRRRLSDNTEEDMNSIKSDASDSIDGDKESEESDVKHTDDSSDMSDEKSGWRDRQCSARRRIYIRVQYDKTLIETLPLEIMRERYPQVLIDYLLSCAVYS
ncbi:unnamed protein product [Phytomonas sp. EM1]|nr:unnamed protein product [Phytomonas sp. EM1]|eukprot:CCW62245.1 unnamed protein product [Phytomonas sp. isolate EM1]